MSKNEYLHALLAEEAGVDGDRSRRFAGQRHAAELIGQRDPSPAELVSLLRSAEGSVRRRLCRSGYRSAIAVSLLKQHGAATVADRVGGSGARAAAGLSTRPGAEPTAVG